MHVHIYSTVGGIVKRMTPYVHALKLVSDLYDQNLVVSSSSSENEKDSVTSLDSEASGNNIMHDIGYDTLSECSTDT